MMLIIEHCVLPETKVKPYRYKMTLHLSKEKGFRIGPEAICSSCLQKEKQCEEKGKRLEREQVHHVCPPGAFRFQTKKIIELHQSQNLMYPSLKHWCEKMQSRPLEDVEASL